VADEKDLMENLLPFWVENYFRHPSYLKVDNKPLLFIYRPEFLIDDLGSVENVRRALDEMRQACRAAGFDGLYLLGEYRGLDPNHLRLMRDLGLDYTFAYVWYVPNNPTPEEAIAAQIQYITKTQELGILPQVVTVSQAWSGWHDEGTIWKIPPREFEDLLRWAKDFIAGLPQDQLSGRMLLLDNWNEWGEGHYIAPYREYGFGYLDAVRKVFALAAEPHVDLIPEDIGLGPYDSAYRAWAERQETVRRQASRRVLKAGAPEPGLVAWWAFDDDAASPVVMDYSGNRLGGTLEKARLVPGLDGNALLCDGGCAVVPNNPALSITDAISIECWAKTDVAGQDNRWMVNRIFAGGVDTGYRLGLLHGRPCFEIPVTAWSHHL
ncbi:MAG: glycoside hydrolase family 99-like domain-containing protein, partial [Armatimonadetes bacterium]|nr:glycoside hydrolase family 99-like domain-containing protein [Armatimonadota bacterium]